MKMNKKKKKIRKAWGAGYGAGRNNGYDEGYEAALEFENRDDARAGFVSKAEAALELTWANTIAKNSTTATAEDSPFEVTPPEYDSFWRSS